MSTANFSLIFDGEAVRDGEIDVIDLAPALVALSQVINAVGKIIIGSEADVNLKIRTMKDGSFEIFLNAISNGNAGLAWGMVKAFFKSDDMQTAKAVIDTLIGTGKTIGGVIDFLRKLKGRPIIKQETLDDNNVKILAGDESIITKIFVLQVAQNQIVRINLEKIISHPLSKDGIEAVKFKNGDVVQEITKEEAKYFNVNIRADTEFNSTYQKAFSIQTLSFKRGNKWKLHDGQGGRTISMLDQDFMERVENSEIAFSKNDVLVCDVRETSGQTASGFKSTYEILRVVEHRPYMIERGFDFNKNEK